MGAIFAPGILGLMSHFLVELSCPMAGKVIPAYKSFGFCSPERNCLTAEEMIKMQSEKPCQQSNMKIYRVKICQDTNGCYSFSVRHTGHFKLCDYEEIELEVRSAKLVERA